MDATIARRAFIWNASSVQQHCNNAVGPMVDVLQRTVASWSITSATLVVSARISQPARLDEVRARPKGVKKAIWARRAVAHRNRELLRPTSFPLPIALRDLHESDESFESDSRPAECRRPGPNTPPTPPPYGYPDDKSREAAARCGCDMLWRPQATTTRRHANPDLPTPKHATPQAVWPAGCAGWRRRPNPPHRHRARGLCRRCTHGRRMWRRLAQRSRRRAWPTVGLTHVEA